MESSPIPERQWCLYCHTCIPSGKKYVGITCQKPSRRWNNGKGYGKRTVMGCAITKYGWDAFTHEIIATGLSAEQAEELEKSTIAGLNTIHPNGYNLDGGGNINKEYSIEMRRKLIESHQNMPDEVRKKISDSRKGKCCGDKNPMYGKHLSEEAKEKLRKQRIGKTLSEETKAKIGQASKNMSPEIRAKVGESMRGDKNHWYGKHRSDEMRSRISASLTGRFVGADNPCAKSVAQFDKSGNLIATYGSIADAGRSVGIWPSLISRCCLGGSKSCAGFVWRHL